MYYVVWKGRNTGIFSNWDECKKQVSGFSKPEYKKFPTLEIAKYVFENNFYEEFVNVDTTCNEFQNKITEEIFSDMNFMKYLD